MQGNMISPMTRADALGNRFRKGMALGSARAISGRERSSGIASETKPWRVAPPKINDVTKTVVLSQNTGSLRSPPLFRSDRAPRLRSAIRHPHDWSASLAVHGNGKRPDLVIVLRRQINFASDILTVTKNTISSGVQNKFKRRAKQLNYIGNASHEQERARHQKLDPGQGPGNAPTNGRSLRYPVHHQTHLALGQGLPRTTAAMEFWNRV
jgi:hypothetical protein